VLRGVENPFGEPPLVDFLNPRARRSFLKGPAPSENFRQTVRAMGEMKVVEVRKPQDALVGFMTLFTDSVTVAALAAASSGGTTYVNYRVTSQNSGYQLEYYPQYNFSPVVFGSTLTYPVTANIKSGHYYFQGWSGGILHTESRVHFAGKNNTSTVIQAF